jgi:hypothetical protein
VVLPESVTDLVERGPAEDLVLACLRAGLPEVRVQSLIERDQAFPVVIVRRGSFGSLGVPDPRFLDVASMSLQAITEGIDADIDSSNLLEAVRVVLWRAYRQSTVFPGLGHISDMAEVTEPRRVTDWATATGPVQYADLPSGLVRYEARYEIEIRRALSG